MKPENAKKFLLTSIARSSIIRINEGARDALKDRKDLLMLVSDVFDLIVSLPDGKSAWEKGVKDYALFLLNTLDADTEIKGNMSDVEDTLLNGAPSWHDYSWGGCAHIYDKNIARDLCSPSEYKRKVSKRDGQMLKPNANEEWLDVQARALYQAYILIFKAVKAQEFRMME